QRAERELLVVHVVLDQEDDVLHASIPSEGLRPPSVKKKVAPSSGAASAQTSPPCRRMMRWTIASPTPVPGKSVSAWSRWNTPNNLSAYCISNPAPLSRMKYTG